MRLSLIVVAILCLAAGSSSAHEPLQTEPEPGHRSKRPVERVTASFEEELAEASEIEVNDGCGVPLVEATDIEARTITATLREGEPGSWFVYYRIVARNDGHESSGSFTFEVLGDTDCSDAVPVQPDVAARDDAGNDPVSVWIPIAAFAVIFGGLALIRTIRSRKGSRADEASSEAF